MTMITNTNREYIVAEVERYCGKVLTAFGIADEYSVSKKRRENIVRCRDCKYYHPGEIGFSESDVCERIPHGFETWPDGFCAWAKK